MVATVHPDRAPRRGGAGRAYYVRTTLIALVLPAASGATDPGIHARSAHPAAPPAGGAARRPPLATISAATLYRRMVASAPGMPHTQLAPIPQPAAEPDPFALRPADAPTWQRSSVWERMAECRAENRVRVLNLWSTGDGSLSLQAGRHGEPSLQWTYRMMGRGHSGRALLDPWFSWSNFVARRGTADSTVRGAGAGAGAGAGR
jgi:hypothetical protein